jgi:hypothetical protein
LKTNCNNKNKQIKVLLVKNVEKQEFAGRKGVLANEFPFISCVEEGVHHILHARVLAY